MIVDDRKMSWFQFKAVEQSVQISVDSKFQSKRRVLDTADVKEDFFVCCSGNIKSACLLFHGFCSFVLRHLCPVCPLHKAPITAILSTHLLLERIDLIRNPISACRLISWNNILPTKHVSPKLKLRWTCRNIWSPSDFFGRVNFSLTYSEKILPYK